MFSFFKNKKADKLNKLLQSGEKLPTEVSGLINEIEKLAPKEPKKSFQTDLKSKLLAEYAKVSNEETSEDGEEVEASFVPAKNMWAPWKMGLSTALAVIVILIGSYPFIPAPRVNGYTESGRTVAISYNAPIKIQFTQPMSRGSVEDHFAIEPNIKGDFDWSGNTLMFYPETPFKEGDIYSVTIGSKAKSLFQKDLAYEYTENFKIVPAPEAKLITPGDDATEVPVDSKITFMFDRPMAGLEPLKSYDLDKMGISIEPKVDGRVKFLGTSSFQFIPEKLDYSTDYSIKLEKGLEAQDGGYTEQEYLTKFSTVSPKVVAYQSADAFFLSKSSNTKSVINYYSKNSQNPQLTVGFNQPMDLSKFKQGAHMYKINNDELKKLLPATQKQSFIPDVSEDQLMMAKAEEVAFDVSYHDFSNAEQEDQLLTKHGLKEDTSKNYLDVKTKQALELDSLYLLSLDENLQAQQGTLKLGSQSRFLVRTPEPFSLVSTLPLAGNAQAEDSYIALTFANPIKDYEPEELAKLIKISPLEKDVEVNYTRSDYDPTNIYIYNVIQPSTSYTVELSSDLEDQFGQKITGNKTLAFTSAQAKPTFDIASSYAVNILNAYKPIEFFARSTNAKKLNLGLKQLSEEEFLKVYGDGYLNLYSNQIEGPLENAEVNLQYEFNKKQFTRLDLEKIFNKKITPGIYYLEAVSPEIKDFSGKPMTQKVVFIASENALTYKHSKNEVLVWATSMNSGQPTANVSISVRDRAGKVLAEGVTNSDGLYQAKISDPTSSSNYNHPDIHVFGRTNSDFAFVSNTWSDGVASWNFNLSTSYLPIPYYATVYTDRPIYRPGDTVSFKGIIREAGNNDLKLPSLKSNKVKIVDTLGQTVFEKDLAISANGSFNSDFVLANQAATGRYSIEAILPAPNGEQHYVNGEFYVNEYKKPEYLVQLKPDKENYVQGEKINVDISGEYFFGASMPNAEVEWTVKSEDYYFNNYEGDAWYSFSEDGYFCYWGCGSSSDVVTQGKGKLDENGHLTLSVDANLKEKKVSQFYTVEATILDNNNQSVSNRISVPVHQGQYYVGIANDDYVVKVGEDMELKLVAVDYDGNPLKGVDVEVSLYEREWNTVKKKNVDGGFYYENEYEDTYVDSEDGTSDDQGKTSVKFKVDKGGLYHLIAKSKDKGGNEIVASTNSYVSSNDFVYWGFDNNDRIEIIPDKQEYKVGDTAKLLIKSPFEGAYALLTYERENVESKKVIKLDSNSTTIEVPINEDFLPNMFVSVAIFKGSNSTAGLPELEDSENEREVAAFKVGYTTLQVNTELKKLNVGLKLNKDANQRFLPGEEVTVDVSTKDVNGNPVGAEVSVSVVDESVLSLTDKFVADLLNTFYRNRALGVESAYTMSQALSRINVQIEAGLKGGGGGFTAKRSTFKDTAFWEANLQTNAKGQGQVKFTLPDNLTSWEVLAVAVSRNTLVGSERISFKTQKDVMIRPALPRFISVKDSFDAAVIINNNTDKDVAVDTYLNAEHMSVSNENQKVTIPANGQQKVTWAVVAPDTLVAKDIKFSIGAKDSKGTDLGDQVDVTIPLQGTSFAEYVATSGSVNENITELEYVIIPDSIEKSLSELTIKIAPTFITSVQYALREINYTPYTSAEQVASVLLPNVKMKQMMELPIIPADSVDVKTLDANVNAGIQNLYASQQANGGWGFWIGSKTSSYISAQVVLALNEAKKAGYVVDDGVINNAVSFLKKDMNNTSLLDNENDELDANTRAFILFVLSELDQADTGLANNLYDNHKEKLNLLGKTYLAMTFQKTGALNKANTLKDEIVLLKEDTPRGVSFKEKDHFYSIFDTDTRTTALVLQMLSRLDAQNPINEKIVHFLLNERKGFNWETTQETSTVIGALLEYVKTSGEANPNFEAKMDVNKNNLITKFYTPDSIDAFEKTIAVDELDENNEIAFTLSGVGKLYYDMVLKYFLPIDKIEYRNEGLVVYQEYFDINDTEEKDTINQIPAGKNIKAKMTVVVPENRYYVSVEDFIPAGLEPIDSTLKTSEQGLQEEQSSFNWWNNLWHFNHTEFRDDRVVYFADFLPRGVYEIEYYLRATTTGEFIDLPARAQEMYVPEVFGQTNGGIFKVLP